jgi:HSP20 family protein
MYLTTFKPIHQVVDDFFNSNHSSNLAFSPAVDIFENENTLHLRVEIPGVKKEDLAVKVENDVLIISGEKRRESDIKNKDHFLNERSYGKFERRFKLNNSLDSESLSAAYNDGVLQISIARKSQSLAREIEVR